MRLPVVLLTVVLSSLHPVEAYPTGAAQCLAGSENPAGPHAGADKGNTETDYTVTIDGYGDFDSNGQTLDVPAGEALTLQLMSKGDKAFKGFLFRLSSDGVDVSGSLTNPSSNPDIQIMESTGESVGAFPGIGTCDENVSGATHTDGGGDNKAYEKTDVSAVLNVDAAAIDAGAGFRTLTLEVTVVTQKDEYYFSEWPLIVRKQGASAVPAPTIAPGPPDAGSPTAVDPMTSQPTVAGGAPSSAASSLSASAKYLHAALFGGVIAWFGCGLGMM